MDRKVEKVYVAVGNNLRDGYKTLEWTLRKWSSQHFSITILHVDWNVAQDLVCSPFGRLPASFVSEEALQVYKKYEQENIDKILLKYKAFCGKVKVEVLKVQIHSSPVHKLVVDLISRHRMKKIVMGITFMKSSSRKLKSAIEESFYVYQHKPEFCELYLLYRGRLVYVNEGSLEDDQGVPITQLKQRASLKGLLGRVFAESSFSKKSSHCLSISSTISDSKPPNNYSANVLELENYFKQLFSSNLDEEVNRKDELLQTSYSSEPDIIELVDSTAVDMIGLLRSKRKAALDIIELQRKEAKSNADRQAKAEWAISLCDRQAGELETSIKQEVSHRVNAEKYLSPMKDQLHEIIKDVEESKRRLSSLTELQYEISNKLLISTQVELNVEVQLNKAAGERALMVRDTEELRRQRDVLRRRINFCKDMDTIGKVKTLKDLTWTSREYTAEDIRLATGNFSERRRLKMEGQWTNVYKGRINHLTVAVKMLCSLDGLSQEAFQAKVKLLVEFKHPHLVAIIGFCSELNCIIYEYMHKGSLSDILFPSHRTSGRKKIQTIHWQDRVRIASEICSGLAFLHLAQPKPIFHGHLTLSDILLDRSLVAKVHNYGLSEYNKECDMRSDIRVFGVLVLYLLTGKNWAGHLEESMNVDMKALVSVLDGHWPCDLAQELAGLAVKCSSLNNGRNEDLSMEGVMHELNVIREKANEIMSKEGCRPAASEKCPSRDCCEDAHDVPSYFLCPILQETMRNPHVAADGFSYELEAIKEWLATGNETSPMTNLKLEHKCLAPNHTLRSLILDWETKRSITPS